MKSFILNYVFAWVCVFISLLLGLKFVSKKYSSSNSLMKSLNKILHKTHMPLGILLICVGFIHGLYSGVPVFSINIGTICWALSILLALNYFLRKLLKGKRTWIKYHRLITLLFLGSIVVHVIDVGGIYIFDEFDNLYVESSIIKNTETPTTTETPTITEAPTTTETPTTTEAPTTTETPTTTELTEMPIVSTEIYNNALGDAILKDGTYTGVADGFGPGLTVSVSVLDNKITDIQIIEHNEKQSRYYAKPIQEIPSKIIESQSLDVDVVSGATYTSVGILNAVLDAISQALVSGTLPDMIPLKNNRH